MALDRARADLARLQAEVRRLEMQLAAAREQVAKVSHYIEISELYDSGATAAAPSRRDSGGRAATAAAAVVDILRVKGHPVPTRELVELLKERGIVFDTTNPVTNLSSALSRSDDLMGDRSHGWSLTEWSRESRQESSREAARAASEYRSIESDDEAF